MNQYLVAIELEDGEDIDTFFHGPFKSYERALDFAGRIGRNAGLNHSGNGAWAATDGVSLVSMIAIRKINSPSRPKDIGMAIRAWFTQRGRASS